MSVLCAVSGNGLAGLDMGALRSALLGELVLSRQRRCTEHSVRV